MSRRGAWIVGVLLLAAVALVGVELGKGALHEPAPKIANPCRARGGHTGGIDAIVQRVVLDGLDGAACRLHTTREELVLAIGGTPGVGPRWNRRAIEVALRAGMLRAVDAAVQRGDLPGVLAPPLRAFVRHAPLGELIRGGFGLRDLLG